MVRKLFGVLSVGLALCLGAVLADEISGTITKCDTTKKTITVKGDDGKETTMDVADDAKIGGGLGGKGGGGKGGGGKGGGGKGFGAGGLEGLDKMLGFFADKGGVKAKITRDDKTKKVTEITYQFGGKGKGGGGGQ
jgi:hypothetical protein